MRWTLLLLACAACADPQLTDNPSPSCPEQSCSAGGGCLEGFVCVNGACALPVSCGQMLDRGCPQDGYPYGLDDCLWTGCHCYANDHGGGGNPPPTCRCTSDAEAQSQGWAYCDETADTCTSSPQPGSCAGTVTCSTAAPACPEGQVAAVRDGCYTGSCTAIDTCDTTPACTALQHESDCTARSDCAAAYEGIDCTDPSGGACTSGSTQCTCQSYQFSSCGPGSPPT